MLPIIREPESHKRHTLRERLGQKFQLTTRDIEFFQLIKTAKFVWQGLEPVFTPIHNLDNHTEVK